MDKKALIQKLNEIGAIKQGSFTLKSGAISPIYIDLRQIIAYPSLMQAIAKTMWDKVSSLCSHIDLLCGVPYTALPLATCLSLHLNKPMLIVRKEAKSYGTQKWVEGVYQANQSCLIIEDVVTSGSSILTTIDALKKVGLQAPIAVSLIDREQGGKSALKSAGCQLHSVFTLKELLVEA